MNKKIELAFHDIHSLPDSFCRITTPVMTETVCSLNLKQHK